MTYREHSRLKIHPYKEESLFKVRVLHIGLDAGVRVREGIGCGFEADAVLLKVESRFAIVPFEFYVSAANHAYIIHIWYIFINVRHLSTQKALRRRSLPVQTCQSYSSSMKASATRPRGEDCVVRAS